MYQNKYIAHMNHLNEMLSFIMDVLDDLSIELKIKKKIYIISEEALTNIIKHAYQLDSFTLPDKLIYIKIDINKKDLVILFQDKGIKYDFDKIDKGNLKKKTNDGIGVFLIKSFADSAEYTRLKDLNNLKILIKNVL